MKDSNLGKIQQSCLLCKSNLNKWVPFPLILITFVFYICFFRIVQWSLNQTVPGLRLLKIGGKGDGEERRKNTLLIILHDEFHQMIIQTVMETVCLHLSLTASFSYNKHTFYLDLHFLPKMDYRSLRKLTTEHEHKNNMILDIGGYQSPCSIYGSFMGDLGSLIISQFSLLCSFTQDFVGGNFEKGVEQQNISLISKQHCSLMLPKNNQQQNVTFNIRGNTYTLVYQELPRF